MVIQTIKFQKKGTSLWSAGIRIEAGHRDWILDENGKEVKQVHDYKVLIHDLHLDIHPILKHIKERLN